MTREQMIEKFSPLSPEETFMKEYKSLSDPAQKKAFCNAFQPDFVANIFQRYFIVLEEGEEAMSLDENTSFEEDARSVLIRKHNRYSNPVLHNHSFFEIVYVLCGNCEQLIEGSTIRLRAGDLFFIAPGVAHSINAQNDTALIMNILVKKSNFEQMYIHMLGQEDVISTFFTEALYTKGNRHYLYFHMRENESASDPLMMLLSEYKSKEPFSNLIRESLLMTMFYYLMRDHINDVDYENDQRLRHNRLADISIYLWNNMATVTLEEAAQAFHYSPSRLSHLFRTVTGSSFSTYIKEIRLKRAGIMLQHTTKSIEEICAEIGLTGTEYFYRAFKKQFGMTPKEYRQGIR